MTSGRPCAASLALFSSNAPCPDIGENAFRRRYCAGWQMRQRARSTTTNSQTIQRTTPACLASRSCPTASSPSSDERAYDMVNLSGCIAARHSGTSREGSIKCVPRSAGARHEPHRLRGLTRCLLGSGLQGVGVEMVVDGGRRQSFVPQQSSKPAESRRATALGAGPEVHVLAAHRSARQPDRGGGRTDRAGPVRRGARLTAVSHDPGGRVSRNAWRTPQAESSPRASAIARRPSLTISSSSFLRSARSNSWPRSVVSR